MAHAFGGHATQLVAQAMQCQKTLQDLLSRNDLERQEYNFLSSQWAAFNLWCFKMGVNKLDQRSLDFRLKDLPEKRECIAGLLEALSQSLQNLLQAETVDDHADGKLQIREESDDEDSDCSSCCPDSLPSSDDDSDIDVWPNMTWAYIEDTLEMLREQARLIESAGMKHKQARIERFKNKPGQRQVYELFRTIAREKVDHQFKRSPLWMKERIAESFARRRMRFEYFKQHQQKLAVGLNEPRQMGAFPPPFQTQNDPAGTTLIPFPKTDTQVNKQDYQNTMPRAGDHSVILSATDNTLLDTISPPPIRVFPSAESVASVTMRHGGFPRPPKLQGSDIFTCPYCFLVFPSTEAEGISWSQHVMKDFEPYFCVFKDCSEPFEVHNSFEGLLTHIHDSHVSARYYFTMPDGSNREFENRQLLEEFLQEKLHIPRSEWNSLAELGREKTPFLFETCHFCGGYPDVVRNCFPDPTTPSAQAEMKKHIKQHMQEIALYLPPISDDVADAPEEDNISDNAVGTQSSTLDKLSAVTWCTQSQQELRDSQVQMEPTNAVDEQLQFDSKIEAQHDDSVKKNHGIERSKENKDGDKSAQKPVAWSEWSKWAFDKEQQIAYRVRQDQDGNIDYDYNYEPTRQNTPETPRYPEEDDRLADRPMDTSATSSDEAISNLDKSDENLLRGTHKDKPAEPLVLEKGKGKSALKFTPAAHPSHRATSQDNDSQMLSRKSVPKTASLDQNKLSSLSAAESSFLDDDSHPSHQQANAGDDTVRNLADSRDEPEEDLDPRYRIHHANKFQPGEILKVYLAGPARPEFGRPSISEVYTLYAGFRRLIVVANDLDHCTCVPIFTYHGKACKMPGVRPEEHGIIHEMGRQARPLNREPKLGFPPVQARIHEDGETLQRECRVNYSKLVTVEHNVKVYFVGSLGSNGMEILDEAVNKCWNKKSQYRARAWGP